MIAAVLRDTAIRLDPVMTFNTTQTYSIAAAALTGIVLLPGLVVGALSLVRLRRCQDQARSGIPWLKATFPLFFVYVPLPLCTGHPGHCWH